MATFGEKIEQAVADLEARTQRATALEFVEIRDGGAVVVAGRRSDVRQRVIADSYEVDDSTLRQVKELILQLGGADGYVNVGPNWGNGLHPATRELDQLLRKNAGDTDREPLGRRFRVIRGASGRWVAQDIVGETATGEIEITGVTPREWPLDRAKRDIAQQIRATLEGKRDARDVSAPGGGASFVIEV